MKEVKLVVTSDMSDELYGRLKNGIEEKFGNDIIIEKTVDDSIIGGFIADVEGEVYDLSIDSQLKKMAKHIEGQ